MGALKVDKPKVDKIVNFPKLMEARFFLWSVRLLFRGVEGGGDAPSLRDHSLEQASEAAINIPTRVKSLSEQGVV